MRYGFVIDQNRCIGCHACTIACKEEHNIAIGVNRTWVKYIEKGRFPDTRRHFAVLRCNHCDDAPCIEICPTVALFRRENGIVDFDGDRCIGCKSCMQACPYDALYIDPDKNTAAKCNFDASRVERGYKPACEVVCPTQAILSGDLDDPASVVSQVVATQKVTVRKPEKGTKPKLFYVGVDGDLLQPTMMEPQTAHFWAEKQPGEDLYALQDGSERGATPGGAREVYDIAHPQPWGKKIASYLWTKSIAAGVLLVAALILSMGHEGDEFLLNIASPVIALGFLAATLLLLVFDLKRPDRFHFVLIKPNLRSWLVLGGYILSLYGVLAAFWLGYARTPGAIPAFVVWPTALLAVGSACYSAFLFAQAKGRELWQSPILFWHLLVQALSAGSAVLIVAGAILGASESLIFLMSRFLAVSLLLGLALILGDISLSHGSESLKRATDLLKSGGLCKPFWLIAIGLGVILPLALILRPDATATAYVVAALSALIGLWSFEDLWVKAGQSVPLS
jgi:Fe-S-cluster-containing dehydrogenase component/formate-dependent nitrite reductase membrane component NrfD